VVRVLSLSGADVSTRALTPGLKIAAFGVWLGSVGGEAPSPNQYLYLRDQRPRLPLKAFRGVRAISQLDWPFTPTPSSSEHFST
jgi:hypothetical protein